MKFTCILFLILFSISTKAQEFSKYQWKKRLVVLVSSNFNDPKPTAQFQMLKVNSKELEEREMLVLKVDSNSTKLQGLGIEKDFEGVLLIGKDGGLKARYPYTVEPSKLFELVDSMPMRKVEMQKKGKD